jgi:hypothetical protein
VDFGVNHSPEAISQSLNAYPTLRPLGIHTGTRLTLLCIQLFGLGQHEDFTFGSAIRAIRRSMCSPRNKRLLLPLSAHPPSRFSLASGPRAVYPHQSRDGYDDISCLPMAVSKKGA